MSDETRPLLSPPLQTTSKLTISKLFVVSFLTALAFLIGFFLVPVANLSLNVGHPLLKSNVSLKIMSLNTWGMPQVFGSEDKEARMNAIGRHIRKAEHDLYLLEELWMRHDHETIQGYVPVGWYMTDYDEMTNGKCDGVVAPDGCSGLALVSKYPFIERSFVGYDDTGSIEHITDGEYLARKGFGKVRIEPKQGYIVDVFWTHTCASDYNDFYRQRQVKQLMRNVLKSEADFVVLGGDFNADPIVNAKESTLKDINDSMVNSIEEYVKKWLVPAEATYGNIKNSYSFRYGPRHYDYIFHRVNVKNEETQITTRYFSVPILQFNKDPHHIVSFSDHQAVVAELMLFRK